MWIPSRAAAERTARRRSTYYASINVWAFVSVMLALVFLFIGNIPTDHQTGGSVDLPKARNAVLQPKSLREDAIHIAVTRDGRIYFRRTGTSSCDLASLIRKALQEGAEEKVYLAADARANYRDVKIVLDQIRLAGIDRIAILTTN